MLLPVQHFEQGAGARRLLGKLEKGSARQLNQIGTRVSLPGRAIVFRENQLPHSIFVVCKGRLKLSTSSPHGHVMILRLAGAGDFLGLSAALNNTPYEVTAETLEPTVLSSIPRGDFLKFLQSHAGAGKELARLLARENRKAFLEARRLALSRSASGRLARLLLDWDGSASCGQPVLRFTMALTHEELANMAGTSRETVTRLLNRYEREGLIQRRGVSISILRPDQLNFLAR